MIGKVIFQGPKGRSEVVLEDDGTVYCSEPSLSRIFQSSARAYREDYSPSQGQWGAQLLHEWEHLVEGRIVWEPKPTPPEERVY